MEYIIYLLLFCLIIFIAGKYSQKKYSGNYYNNSNFYKEILPPHNLRIIAVISIIYSDINEEMTARSIFITKIDANGSSSLIYAWCGLRGEIRHFRSDRILAAYEPSTGKQIKNISRYINALERG